MNFELAIYHIANFFLLNEEMWYKRKGAGAET